MKKFQVLFVLMLLTLAIACSRKADVMNPTKPNQNSTGRLIEAPEEKNYCKGCGSTMDEHFYCSHRTCQEDGGCSMLVAGGFYPEMPTSHTDKVADLHDLRDNFLINYDFGQDYITYYYELSAIAIDSGLITSGNYLDWLSFASDLLDAANTIRDGSPTDIPVNSTLKATAMGYITLFRNNTTDTVILGYLDQIEADLIDITGKDVAYIIAKLEA